MILRVLTLLSSIAFGLCIAQELTFPATICHRDSADYSTCLKNAIQEAWPQIVKGLPAFDFLPLDPLFYKKHHAKYDNGDIHADIDATNVTLTGLNGYRFDAVKMHFSDDILRMEIDSHLSKTFCEGNVKIVGSIGPFRINNTGLFNISTTDVKVRWIITGHIANDRWNIERFRAIPTFTTLKVYLSGIMGSEEFDSLVNDFVNEFWPMLYRAMGKLIIDTWEPWAIDVTNRIFSKLSFSKTFPK